MVDLALLGNLVLMVTFVGYENFVSKLHATDHEDRPDWMEFIDFGGLKLKPLSSIVAISAIHLLRKFGADAGKGQDDAHLYLLRQSRAGRKGKCGDGRNHSLGHEQPSRFL